MNDEEKKQIKFFNDKKNQYSAKEIITPPIHTILEIKEILEGLKDVDGKSIIDFGAGTGRVTIPLLQNNFSVTAVDISDKSLISLKNTAHLLNYNHLNISNVLPTKGTWNAIVGADILHHISLETFLPKFNMILNKGGRLVFSEPGAWNLFWYLYLPFFTDWKVEKGITTCSINNLSEQFNRFGFSNIKIKGLGLFPRALFKWSPMLCAFNDWLGNIPGLRFFAYRYIIEVEK